MKTGKNKLNQTTVIVLIVFLIIMAILAFTGMIPIGGTGIALGWIEHKQSDTWSADYTYFTGRRTSILRDADDTMHIEVTTDGGTLDITVLDTEGNPVFSKQISETSSFDAEVPDQVTVSVKAQGHKGGFDISYQPSSPGQIFLYGEEHGVEPILEEEFQLWSTYYHNDGMRDLFVELPYYTAEFMNLWMQSENDEILDALYEDWNGTAMHTPEVRAFYERIKSECPETIFHGTDVGHQYNTTGARFLEYLQFNGKAQSEEFALTQEAIEQGKFYYEHRDQVYRENVMTENFIREFEKLNGADIMGIYGSAHTGTEAMDYSTNTVPCMANQLSERYTESLHATDLTHLAKEMDAYKVDIIQIGEKEYEASYFGKADLTAFST